MTDVPSVTTFVVEDRFPWPDDAPGFPERGPFEHGLVFACGEQEQCTIRKISPRGATVCGELGRSEGERIAIELGTGQRPSGTVAWARRGEFGVSFNEPIDMLALLNRKLVSQPVERRTMPRVEIRCPVHVKCGATLVVAALRNISAKGLQLEREALPQLGSYVALFAEGLNLPAGEIVWRRGNLAGVELFEEMSWTSVIPWVRSLVRR